MLCDDMLCKTLKGLWEDANRNVPSEGVLREWAAVCGCCVPQLRRWFSQCTITTAVKQQRMVR